MISESKNHDTPTMIQAADRTLKAKTTVDEKNLSNQRENILAPSILSADFARLGEDVEAAERGGAKWLHFDVMDGIFVPSISFGFPVLESLKPRTKLFMDVHLMITEPIRYVERFAAAGADMITFHAEAAFDIKGAIDKIHACGKKAGLSIKPHTDISAVKPYLKDLDMVLIMSVEPGFGGQAYIAESTKKIRDMRLLMDDSGRYDMPLEVDGGIKISNVREVLGAGANVIVAGSAVFNKDTEENTKKFMELLKTAPE